MRWLPVIKFVGAMLAAAPAAAFALSVLPVDPLTLAWETEHPPVWRWEQLESVADRTRYLRQPPGTRLRVQTSAACTGGWALAESRGGSWFRELPAARAAADDLEWAESGDERLLRLRGPADCMAQVFRGERVGAPATPYRNFDVQASAQRHQLNDFTRGISESWGDLRQPQRLHFSAAAPSILRLRLRRLPDASALPATAPLRLSLETASGIRELLLPTRVELTRPLHDGLQPRLFGRTEEIFLLREPGEDELSLRTEDGDAVLFQIAAAEVELPLAAKRPVMPLTDELLDASRPLADLQNTALQLRESDALRPAGAALQSAAAHWLGGSQQSFLPLIPQTAVPLQRGWVERLAVGDWRGTPRSVTTAPGAAALRAGVVSTVWWASGERLHYPLPAARGESELRIWLPQTERAAALTVQIGPQQIRLDHDPAAPVLPMEPLLAPAALAAEPVFALDLPLPSRVTQIEIAEAGAPDAAAPLRLGLALRKPAAPQTSQAIELQELRRLLRRQLPAMAGADWRLQPEGRGDFDQAETAALATRLALAHVTWAAGDAIFTSTDAAPGSARAALEPLLSGASSTGDWQALGRVEALDAARYESLLRGLLRHSQAADVRQRAATQLIHRALQAPERPGLILAVAAERLAASDSDPGWSADETAAVVTALWLQDEPSLAAGLAAQMKSPTPEWYAALAESGQRLSLQPLESADAFWPALASWLAGDEALMREYCSHHRETLESCLSARDPGRYANLSLETFAAAPRAALTRRRDGLPFWALQLSPAADLQGQVPVAGRYRFTYYAAAAASGRPWLRLTAADGLRVFPLLPRAEALTLNSADASTDAKVQAGLEFEASLPAGALSLSADVPGWLSIELLQPRWPLGIKQALTADGVRAWQAGFAPGAQALRPRGGLPQATAPTLDAGLAGALWVVEHQPLQRRAALVEGLRLLEAQPQGAGWGARLLSAARWVPAPWVVQDLGLSRDAVPERYTHLASEQEAQELLPPLGADERWLVSGEELLLELPVDAVRTLNLEASLSDFPFTALQAAQLEFRLDEMELPKLGLQPGMVVRHSLSLPSGVRQLRLRLSPGAGRVRLRLANGSGAPLLAESAKTLLVAKPGQPGTAIVAGPAVLRVSRLDDNGISVGETHFLSEPEARLLLPAPEQGRRRYQVSLLQALDVLPVPRASAPSALPQKVLAAPVHLRLSGQISQTRPMHLGDSAAPRRWAGDGTLGYYTRLFHSSSGASGDAGDEAERTALELGLSYDHIEPSRVLGRHSRLFTRQAEGEDTLLGVSLRQDWRPSARPWEADLRLTAATQSVAASTGGSALEWGAQAQASWRGRWSWQPSWKLTGELAALWRQQSLNGLSGPTPKVEPEVYSRYRDDHPRALSVSLKTDWTPRHDRHCRAELGLVSNASINDSVLDHRSAELGCDQGIGPVWLGLGARRVERLADDARAQASTINSLLWRGGWLFAMSRDGGWELRLDGRWSDTGASRMQLGLAHYFSAGRGGEDLPPGSHPLPVWREWRREAAGVSDDRAEPRR